MLLLLGWCWSFFFAVYGSKSNIFDVSKHVDELPLNELLDGSYNCPSLVKDKGKGTKDSNESILNSVTKACSLLRLQSPVEAQNSAERDNSYNQKVYVGIAGTGASPASKNDGGKEDDCSVNQPSTDKLNFDDVSKYGNLVIGSGYFNALMSIILLDTYYTILIHHVVEIWL